MSTLQQNEKRYPHAERVLALTKELVHQPSISGTTQEIDMAETIHAILKRNPYFQKNPSHIKQVPLEKDPLGRVAIVAMLTKEPERKEATVLLSHFDVVGVDDFGLYKEDAFLPEQLMSRLLAEQEGYLDNDARKDLESGDYMFGRAVWI
ncbi:hypothetical protein [Bacillus sp. JCM 19041]|uniref:hypothetical protein n=1 Tax=Bacillus sp. JCM 19041 TaxID=1460637 RepID=UPI0006D24139